MADLCWHAGPGDKLDNKGGHTTLWEHRCSDGVGGCTAISVSTLDRLLNLHRRSTDTVEIETWHEDGDACDEPDDRHECPGHLINIHICGQCGIGMDETSDGAVWFEWPCATARALGLDKFQEMADSPACSICGSKTNDHDGIAHAAAEADGNG